MLCSGLASVMDCLLCKNKKRQKTLTGMGFSKDKLTLHTLSVYALLKTGL